MGWMTVAAGAAVGQPVARQMGADSQHTDHLGSILTLTNSSGTPVAEQNFDAWGRARNPSTWTYSAIPSPPAWLYRGYTGHEHLREFGITHMNGRLYDPVLGRMLSPDNYVHTDLGTQGYNRYSYAVNNPMRFTDPGGEIPFVVFVPYIVAGLGGGFMNLMGNLNKVNSFEEGAAFFANGVVGGLGTLATGGNVLAGTTLTASLNLGTDLIYGNLPDLSDLNRGQAAAAVTRYVFQLGLSSWGTAGMGQMAYTIQGVTYQSVGTGYYDHTGQWFLSEAEIIQVGRGSAAPVGGGGAVMQGFTAPKGWITQVSKKGGGIVFRDPNNSHNVIRQMPGNPASPNVLQQNPYVKFMKDGRFYDVNGKVLPNGSVPEAHIPLDLFNFNNMPGFF